MRRPRTDSHRRDLCMVHARLPRAAAKVAPSCVLLSRARTVMALSYVNREHSPTHAAPQRASRRREACACDRVSRTCIPPHTTDGRMCTSELQPIACVTRGAQLSVPPHDATHARKGGEHGAGEKEMQQYAAPPPVPVRWDLLLLCSQSQTRRTTEHWRNCCSLLI